MTPSAAAARHPRSPRRARWRTRWASPHFTIDLRDEFRAGVVEPFIAGFAAGETPNPCVGCNGHVRLDAMLELARRLGCDATGHRALRARSRRRDGRRRRTAAARRGRPGQGPDVHARRAVAESLARMRFPLGELTKPEVRAIAAEAGLPVASKADSQDLCFLAGTDRARFLARHGGTRRCARDDRRRRRNGRRPPRRPAPLHGGSAARPRHRRGRRAAVRPRQGPGHQPRDRGAALRARNDACTDTGRAPTPSREDGRPGQAALSLAPAARATWSASRSPAATRP